MNLALRIVGLLCLAGFCFFWPPAALLLSGAFFLVLAQIRVTNQRNGGGRR